MAEDPNNIDNNNDNSILNPNVEPFVPYTLSRALDLAKPIFSGNYTKETYNDDVINDDGIQMWDTPPSVDNIVIMKYIIFSSRHFYLLFLSYAINWTFLEFRGCR